MKIDPKHELLVRGTIGGLQNRLPYQNWNGNSTSYPIYSLLMDCVPKNPMTGTIVGTFSILTYSIPATRSQGFLPVVNRIMLVAMTEHLGYTTKMMRL